MMNRVLLCSLLLLASTLTNNLCSARRLAEKRAVSAVLTTEGAEPEDIEVATNPDDLKSGCQVIDEDGTDVTDQFVSTQTVDGKERTVVTCEGSKVCMNKIVNNCDIVHCEGLEACEAAHLIDIQVALECIGTHSCHRTELQLTQTELKDGIDRFKVTCEGSGVCNVAQLKADTVPMDVLCSGTKACRKARIEANDGKVECSNGGSRYEACQGSVAIIAKCLVCNGPKSCGDHINICKFSNDGDKWTICKADETFGECE